jgi:hypothetical protein
MCSRLLCFQPLFVIWGKQKGSCSYWLFPSWLWQVVLAMCAFATFQRGVLKGCTLKHCVRGVAKSCVCKKSSPWCQEETTWNNMTNYNHVTSEILEWWQWIHLQQTLNFYTIFFIAWGEKKRLSIINDSLINWIICNHIAIWHNQLFNQHNQTLNITLCIDNVMCLTTSLIFKCIWESTYEQGFEASIFQNIYTLVWTPCLMHRCVYLTVHITKL